MTLSTVADERLRDRLWRAIQGRRVFRCFEDTLAEHPDEEDRWFRFADEQAERRVLDWLAEMEIEPV